MGNTFVQHARILRRLHQSMNLVPVDPSLETSKKFESVPYFSEEDRTGYGRCGFCCFSLML